MNSSRCCLSEALHHETTYDKIINEPVNTQLTCNAPVKDSTFKNLILKILEQRIHVEYVAYKVVKFALVEDS